MKSVKMKTKIFLVVSTMAILNGCGSEENKAAVSGVHFQGRDCLSCHNQDLQADSHLSIGGTVYKSATSDANNLNEACNEKLHLEFGSSALSTKSAHSLNAPGFNGRGNIFALLRDFPAVTGTYSLSIVRDDGTVLASSGAHPFMGGFDANDPTDDNNRYSCNACHQAPPDNKQSAPGLVYTNVILCN